MSNQKKYAGIPVSPETKILIDELQANYGVIEKKKVSYDFVILKLIEQARGKK